MSIPHPQRHFSGNLALDLPVSPGESIGINRFRNNSEGGASTNDSDIAFNGYLVGATP